MNIFEIEQSAKDKDFIIHNLDLELEVLADIVETSKDLPFIGSLIKLGKVGLNVIDLRYVRKLGKFLKEADSIPSDKKQEFYESLTRNDYKRISEYLSHLLYVAEEDSKAELMGRIYRYRLMKQINNEQMLRLCSVVSKSYVTDLSHLGDYRRVNDANNYITDNLNALGLLKDCGNMYEGFDEKEQIETTSWGATKRQLNEIGLMLLNIIESTPIETYVNPDIVTYSQGIANTDSIRALIK